MKVVNPHARFEASERFVFWFGEVAPLHLVVWGSDFTMALDVAASYLAVHAPGHLMIEDGLEHRAALREAAIAIGVDPRHFEGRPAEATALHEDDDLNPFDDETDDPTPPLGTLDPSTRAEVEALATGDMTQTAWGFLDADDWGYASGYSPYCKDQPRITQ